MMNSRPWISVVVAVMALLCSGSSAQISVNQYRLSPGMKKYAAVSGAQSDSFSVNVAKNDSAVFRGRLSAPRFWGASGDSVRLADFSALTGSGRYRVVCKGAAPSCVVAVGGDGNALVKSALKAFYFNRCSTRLDKQYAGVYARRAGHPDTAVLIHPSAADSLRPAGSRISSPGGWYDAGDFNKYSVNSSVAMSLLLSAYAMYPGLFDSLAGGIPESRNALPDILDEVLYNLRWQLTMQDPHDGGVYHKLTTAEFCGMVMPDRDTAARYVVYKSTAAALDFAAVCAQASRVFRRFAPELPGFADSCLIASQRAWHWAQEHPDRYYFNRLTDTPPVKTGEYTDTNVADEHVWAATELLLATGDTAYRSCAFPTAPLPLSGWIPTWRDVGILPLFSVVLQSDSAVSGVRNDAAAIIRQVADSLVALQINNPYYVAVGDGDFFWGSNSHLATMGIIFLLADRLTGDTRYRDAAVSQLDWLLGRNPTRYSFVTGFGEKTPLHIHHRVSTADSIDAPVPGFLAGGPNAGRQDTKHCNCYTTALPARCYADTVCSYASNEVAINWNAPLVFLAAGVAALFGGSK